jgi:two-component system phosphate regulon sensor histidine kinase PhoR
MFKNQTPRQLSLYIAILSSAAIALLTLSLKVVGLLRILWSEMALLFVVASLVAFIVNYYLIRYYIFRRIKLIYKIIHRRKFPPEFRADNLDMSKNILFDLEKEVDEWAEQNSREMEEMERLAAYRRRFIGDVSHELKTPIFNIQGFVHTLLDGALNDPEVNVQYLKRAARNIDRLQTIVEDLETINKLESGHMVLELQEFDIHGLADEVYADLEMRARERNIRLSFKEGAAQHFHVRADKEGIRQVLINLVHNSIKYGTEGGVTKISFYDLESYVLVEVSDSGIGISEEHLKHVFDRFYRVDKSRSRDAGGTGLGLSIVKHIIEAHKQTVNVRSTQGQGSTFGFTLEKV